MMRTIARIAAAAAVVCTTAGLHGDSVMPPEIAETPEARRLYDHGCVTEMDIALLIYRPNAPQGSSKDFEFSRSTMEARWQEGFSDAYTTLQASPWLAPMPQELGVRVFDVMHEIYMRRQKTAAE